MFTVNDDGQEHEQEIKNASDEATPSIARPPQVFLTHPLGGCARQGVRPYQEDRWGGIVLHGEAGIALLGCVHDGVGGHAGGELASSAAVTAMQKAAGSLPLDRPELDRAWMAESLTRAANAAARSGEGASTAVVALVRKDRMLLGWVGDSRGCVVDPCTGTLRWLTQDHHALNSSGQPALSRWLGVTGDPGTPLHPPSLVESELRPGELLMLCTDGVHGTLRDDELIELLRESVWLDDLDATAAWVCDTAIEHGSSDNCSCVLITHPGATDPANTGVESNACSSSSIACNSGDHHA